MEVWSKFVLVTVNHAGIILSAFALLFNALLPAGVFLGLLPISSESLLQARTETVTQTMIRPVQSQKVTVIIVASPGIPWNSGAYLTASGPVCYQQIGGVERGGWCLSANLSVAQVFDCKVVAATPSGRATTVVRQY